MQTPESLAPVTLWTRHDGTIFKAAHLLAQRIDHALVYVAIRGELVDDVVQAVSDDVVCSNASALHDRLQLFAPAVARAGGAFISGRLDERHRVVRDRKKRARMWFELGADALAKVQPNLPRGYGCPLCRRLFPTLDGLSEEHVPPESVGGHPLVLTCRDCNSRHGHDLDHHIRAEADMREVGAGRRPTRGRFTQYGETLNAEITLGAERRIRIVKGNNPAALEAALKRVERDVATKVVPPEIKLELHFRYDAWKAQVAWLRVGYLYAFAAFGYRYAMQEVLDRVREQIESPAKKLVLGVVRCIASPVPVPQCLAFVHEPKELRSLLVGMGERLIFLPGLGDDVSSFYERMAATAPQAGGSVRFSARVSFSLPDRPVFLFDRNDVTLAKVFRES